MPPHHPSAFRTKQLCDGANSSAASTCGRPLGLGFNFKTGELYVLDFKFGFLVVPPGGGLATQLATGFNGTTFVFPNALDIDQANQIVYFTDAGAIFLSRNLSTIIQSNDTSGKLYKYDVRTKTLSLLLNGLSGPLGVAVSKCGAYVLIDEYIASRVRRYWVRGPKAGSSEISVNLPGSPDNIKRTISGDFFAAVTILNRHTFQTTSSVGQRINGDLGIVEATMNLTAQYTNNLISEVQEFLGKLYIGSSTASFVGVYGP
ncbi:protein STRICTOSIDINE SYNTHASE-LIKE 12-like isoform X2 [Coffea eugenioides]|uniref:protein STRICTOSIDINE SYNTHASE-LIKE 12-like isoform X2 n=1 Tax=Coffea eugenioides TaxID=49369 RepID=UPI000F60E414|nr:protein STRICTOSIDINE SYNTHASE-LIKE 12-like isoform X2 [Coffea eugenioides]